MTKAHLAGALGIGLGLAVAGLATLGCTKYPSCKKDEHCRAEAGERCVGGVCQNCEADADCVARTPAGQPPFTCNAYRCGPAGAADAAVAGAGGREGDPCAQPTDCLEGLTCREGACAPCTADVECSPATCNLDSGRCSVSGACQTDDQCAMDEICTEGTCQFSGNLGNDDGGPCGLAAVYFGFDSVELTPKIQEELTATAECITQQGRPIYLEAHADDRGTEEYNILLTERRGTMVRTFLGEQGVPPELMQVIAKGSLEAEGKDEPSRAKERRVALIWP
jgi:peptidoglycan-associated lipoprotein